MGPISPPRPPTVVRCIRLGAILVLSALVGTACAAGPQVGVRSEFRAASIEDASVSPFFARSTFSLSGDALDRRLRWAERAAAEWLAARGVDAVSAAETERQLRSAGRMAAFEEGGAFRVDLSASFDAARLEARRRVQTSTLRELADAGLTRRFVLFGELLYQTSGECRGRAGDHTTRANVVVAERAPDAPPRPCVVTHFQARLVEVSSGSTVWYNRRLRERHVRSVDTSTVRRNVVSTVRRTLGGDGGLGGLLDSAGGET